MAHAVVETVAVSRKAGYHHAASTTTAIARKTKAAPATSHSRPIAADADGSDVDRAAENLRSVRKVGNRDQLPRHDKTRQVRDPVQDEQQTQQNSRTTPRCKEKRKGCATGETCPCRPGRRRPVMFANLLSSPAENRMDRIRVPTRGA